MSKSVSELGTSTKNRGPVAASIAELLSSEYSNKRREAIRKGLDFELTKEEFTALVLSSCVYCGALPAKHRSSSRRFGAFPPIGIPHVSVNGIDRVKSSRGYTKKNSIPCCWACNRAKADMPLARFNEWICRVYEHRPSWSHLIDLHKPSLTDAASRIQRKNRKEASRFLSGMFEYRQRRQSS